MTGNLNSIKKIYKLIYHQIIYLLIAAVREIKYLFILYLDCSPVPQKTSIIRRVSGGQLKEGQIFFNIAYISRDVKSYFVEKLWKKKTHSIKTAR